MTDLSPYIILAGVAILLILFLLFRRWILMPRNMIIRGFDLLSTQETNSRLRHVGQRDADNIADLFNTLLQRLAQERIHLREQENLLSKVMEVTPIGIAMMDFDGRITGVNKAFRDLLHLPANLDINGKRVGELPCLLAESLAAVGVDEEVVLRPDGHTVVRCYSLWFIDSGFRRPFLVVESLTNEVRRAERDSYGKVIRLMAHEVNNSMTGFLTCLDSLKMIHQDDPEIMEVLESVSLRCRGLTDFIGNYASVVRLPEPTLRPMELNSFVSSQLPFLQSMSGIDIRFLPDGNGESVISGDTSMLQQVLVNLVRNSVQSLEEKGKAFPEWKERQLRIEVSRGEEGNVDLLVVDNGKGVSEEARAHIFSPFYSDKPGGQGIGLTLVAEILRRHDATFYLLTEGSETRFRITFPAG